MGQRFSDPDITIREEDEEEVEELLEKPVRRASITIVKTGDAPAPFETRRPSIIVDGRRVSVGSATIVDEVPMSRRTSDAFQSKGISNTRPTLAVLTGGRSSDATHNFSSAKIAGVTSVLEEEEEEEHEATTNEKTPTAASNVESKRASKRRSQLRHSYIAPMVEVTETELAVPAVSGVRDVVDDRLLNCIEAIEEALAVRGIGAVNFTVHDDGVGDVVGEEGSGDVVEMSGDEEKDPDARSMV
jgi:hypothetical protein